MRNMVEYHNKTYPDVPEVGVDRAMRHLSSIVQQLLVHIENLETYVFSV